MSEGGDAKGRSCLLSPGPPGLGGRTHLDSADQSFLLTDMLPSPAAAACRAPHSAAHLRPLPRARWGHMAAYLSRARPRAAALPFAGPGSCLRGVGVPDKAALLSAGAGLPRGRSAGRSHRAAGYAEAGAGAGLLRCLGRGRETSCSEPVGPAWRRPASSLRVAAPSAREWGGGGTHRSGSGRARCLEIDLALRNPRAGSRAEKLEQVP